MRTAVDDDFVINIVFDPCQNFMDPRQNFMDSRYHVTYTKFWPTKPTQLRYPCHPNYLAD